MNKITISLPEGVWDGILAILARASNGIYFGMLYREVFKVTAREAVAVYNKLRE